MLAMARNLEIVAIEPLSRYRNGVRAGMGCPPAPSDAQICFATYRPPWMATGDTPGRPSRVIMSPTTNTSGCPGTVKSGPTKTRPARSSFTPVCAASWTPNGDAATPAAQTLVRDSIRRREPSRSCTSMPASSTSTTFAPSWTSTPRRSSSRCAWVDSLSPNVLSTASELSRSTTRVVSGSKLRKLPFKVRRLSSIIWPAISTPVGPAPTMTKVSHASSSAGSLASSASS